MDVLLSPSVTQTYPGACCGFLAVSGAGNPASCTALEVRKNALTGEIRARFPDEASLKADHILQAYAAYYKRFKKTYHVALQLESVALKGKAIPSVAALVECMFMAELENRLLTAGHDLDIVSGPVRVEVAQGSETYTLLRGVEQALKAGDLYMRDMRGVISDIIYGPDQRTQINPTTTRALFTVYAPPGIGKEAVQHHLETMAGYIRLVSPDAVIEAMRVLPE